MLTTHLTTRTSRSAAPASRGGFTLVELLVSIALVVIMMYAFSQVFEIATETIIQTRGVANNDEKARTLTTLLKSDLETRTFKTVAPWAPGEDPAADYDARPDLQPSLRRGYFYVSENDINDDTDDVLQLTVDRFNGGAVTDTSLENLIFGRAITFAGTDPNVDISQPSWSDFQGDALGAEGLTSSRYVEVVYFVRNGNLYRRALLLYSSVDAPENQPQLNASGDIITGDYDVSIDSLTTPAIGDFWNDFDISAFHNGTKLVLNGVGGGASADDSLENDTTVSALVNPIALPRTRYGFSFSSGLPREFIRETATPIYIGRFTHAETSHAAFDYPGFDSGASSPVNDTTLLDSTGNGIIDSFESSGEGGPRQLEDLLLTNVLSFDVKLWDEGLGRFADVGHNIAGGDLLYASTEVRDNYSPLPSAFPGRIFDTWHSAIDTYDSASGTADPPPYRPDSPSSDPMTFPEPVPRPIRAIQITIRYRDGQSDKTRQLTLQHSLID